MTARNTRLVLLAASTIAWGLTAGAQDAPVNDPALKGAIDIHSHLDPDGYGPGRNGRNMDVLDMAKMAKEAGMRGFVIKMHYDQSADDAYIVRNGRPEPGGDSPDGRRQRRLGSRRLDADVGRQALRRAQR